MKKGILAVVKAALYFGVYFGTQIIVSLVFSIAMSTMMTMDVMASGQELDAATMAAMTEELTVAILDQAMLMTVIAGVLALLVYWIIFLVRKKNFLQEVGIRKVSVNGILPIVLLGMSFNIITTMVVSYVPWPQAWMDSYMASSSMIDTSLIAWIGAVIMAPVVEEIVFRGFIYGRLKKAFPMMVAAVISALAFGAMHGTLIWLIYTFVFGMVLVWVYEKYQSLAACILLHMAYNLVGMLLSYLPEEASVVVIVLFVISIVVAVLSYKMVNKATEGIEKIEETPVVPETVEAEEVVASEN